MSCMSSKLKWCRSKINFKTSFATVLATLTLFACVHMNPEVQSDADAKTEAQSGANVKSDAELIAKLFEPNLEDGHKVIAELQNMAFDLSNVNETSYLISRLVTTEAIEKKAEKNVSFPEWEKSANSKSELLRTRMRRFEARAKLSKLAAYALQLYEENFGQARTVLTEINAINNGIGYLDVFLIQAAHSILNLQLDNYYSPSVLPKRERLIVKKLMKDKSILNWVNSLPSHLKQFSGMTHTISGLYDWISYPHYNDLTGFSDIAKNADAYYDLGGGFATPDVDRIFEKKFTSFDILSPQKAIEWNIVIQVLEAWLLPKFGINKTRIQTPAEREDFMKKVAAVPWVDFDVFKDHFPTQPKSYVITSFGFLSSTVGSLSEVGNKVAGGKDFYSLTYWATKRIVELIAAGKSVDLFTYQRASEKRYRYRTVLLSFRNHRLINAKVYPDAKIQTSEVKILKRTFN